jgi:tRNA/rRNA methyltransferase
VTSPRIVLVRPRNADNLVSIARAMQMFGLTDWVSVSLEQYQVGMVEVLRKHRPASDWHPLLDSLRRVDTLEEAIRDCSYVVGTTMRTLPGRARLSTRELAQVVGARGDSTWALVFGAESNGLMNEDLEHCHAMSFIPSSDEQPSLNLSQAVVVYAHELASVKPRDPVMLANDVELRALKAALHEGLRARMFPYAAADELMAPLLRAGLTSAEMAQWCSVWRGE